MPSTGRCRRRPRTTAHFHSPMAPQQRPRDVVQHCLSGWRALLKGAYCSWFSLWNVLFNKTRHSYLPTCAICLLPCLDSVSLGDSSLSIDVLQLCACCYVCSPRRMGVDSWSCLCSRNIEIPLSMSCFAVLSHHFMSRLLDLWNIFCRALAAKSNVRCWGLFWVNFYPVPRTADHRLNVVILPMHFVTARSVAFMNGMHMWCIFQKENRNNAFAKVHDVRCLWLLTWGLSVRWRGMLSPHRESAADLFQCGWISEVHHQWGHGGTPARCHWDVHAVSTPCAAGVAWACNVAVTEHHMHRTMLCWRKNADILSSKISWFDQGKRARACADMHVLRTWAAQGTQLLCQVHPVAHVVHLE